MAERFVQFNHVWVRPSSVDLVEEYEDDIAQIRLRSGIRVAVAKPAKEVVRLLNQPINVVEE